MAELIQLDSKLAEIMGLAQAATESTSKVMKLVEDGEIKSKLERMHEEAEETARRCESLAGELEGKKGAMQEKAREARSEAEQMMKTYLDGDVDAIDGIEFLLMAEAGELGHVEIVRELNEQAGNEKVRELAEWALPIQQRHFEDTRSAALALARRQNPAEPAS